ncbi:hypothetical protein [Aeromonas salmonicida]|uniref:hypothetical protein n=1 Tax=Aeromonas salmonicida TaxID=645 RepID=UPI002855E5D9|nr:hypothetical protein [Aeromonas salmonicida]MDR6994903.1 hypothetical protein [Aeromonas salmonicida]HEH9415776.1 hypothetical protein [Aeromonas salmonicida]HEH9424594.1 hypothetical protein [Aeromonas salmonicida]HEH9437839.1 hypothetical protein [Aeromonas salmonicida]
MYKYQYASGDLLANPQSYQYSEYIGTEFIDAWAVHRADIISSLPAPSVPNFLQPMTRTVDFGDTVSSLYLVLYFLRNKDSLAKEMNNYIWMLVRKFEVSKRLYEAYDNIVPNKAVKTSDFNNYSIYLLFAECLVRSCLLMGNDTRKLNCLLKVCDTLCSAVEMFSVQQRAQLSWILREEKVCIIRLIDRS